MLTLLETELRGRVLLGVVNFWEEISSLGTTRSNQQSHSLQRRQSTFLQLDVVHKCYG